MLLGIRLLWLTLAFHSVQLQALLQVLLHSLRQVLVHDPGEARRRHASM